MVSGGTSELPFDLGVFDLDGTVLRRDLKITQRTVSALRGLRKRGVRLVVATGRHFEGARRHAGRLGFAGCDPIICYGGSMVRRMDGETLLHRTLGRSVGVEALEWAARRDLHTRVFLDGRVVTSPETPAATGYLNRREETEVCVVDSPADFLRSSKEEPTKLVIIDYPANVGGWLEDARRAFAGRLFVTRSLPHYVEVGGEKGTKAEALGFICRLWGIDRSRTIAFGDADNDVDMLRFAGRGLAVGGMSEEVREVADEVIPPVEEDGVARYLERLLEGVS